MRRATSFQTLLVPIVFQIAAIGLLSLAGPVRAADEKFEVIVTADSTRVMAGEKPIGEVQKGTRLTVSQTKGDLYLVDLPKANPPQQGWVRKSDVQSVSATETVAQLTPEQKQERLKERDHYSDEARQLFADGKFDEAIAAAEKMLAIEQKVFGNDDPEAIGSRRFLTTLHQAKGDLAGARKLCEEELARSTSLLGKDHWQVTDARLALADVESWTALKPEDRQALARCDATFGKAQQLNAKGDAKAALPLLKDVLETRTRLLGPKHRLTGVTYSWLGVVYEHLGQSDDAVTFASQALDIAKEVFGEHHPTYASTLDNLAVLYRENADYAKAEPLCRQALQIRKEVLGEKDPNYARSLNNLAWLYELSGDYAKAEPLFLEGAAIRKQALGEKHHDYAQSLCSVALLYKEMGKYAKAEPLYKQVLEIDKEALGEKNSDYAIDLSNLAALYDATGLYAKAEPLYQQALEIQKEVLGEKHPQYANTLSNLASLYQSMGSYAKAEPILLQAVQLRKEVLGEKHPEYAISLNNLAFLYQGMGAYAKAEPLYEKVLEIQKQVLGEKNPGYVTTLSNLAALYQDMGAYAKAEPLYLKVLQCRKESLGEKSPDYAIALNNLALLYHDMGDYAKAEPLAKQVLEIDKETLGATDPGYAIHLDNMGLLYRAMGDYAKAEPVFKQALEIEKKALGEKHPGYAVTLNNLANLYLLMGAYAQAEPLYLQSLKIKKQAVGEMHPSYANSLNSLADLYENMGDYPRAELLLRQALEIRKQALGEMHPSYANALNSLAIVYKEMGDYARAEPLYRQTAEIQKQVLGEKNADYASSLMNWAGLYSAMGDYAREELLIKQGLEIKKQALGEKHPEYADGLRKLADVYSALHDYAQAEPLYKRSLEISKQVLGEKHPQYAGGLICLAELYRHIDQYAKAKPLYEQTLQIVKTTLGENHPDYATSLQNLALLYHEMGDYDQAEPLYKQALEIKKQVLGEKHPDYAGSLANLGRMYVASGQPDKAVPLSRQALQIAREQLELTAAVQSERQQEAMRKDVWLYLDGYLHATAKAGVPAEEVYGEVLRWKGEVAGRQRRMRQTQRQLTEGKDQTAAKLAADLTDATGSLARLYRSTSAKNPQHDAQLTELSDKIERLQQQLAGINSEFKQQHDQQHRTTDDIRKALPADAVLIDLLGNKHFQPAAEKGKPGTFPIDLVAFVVRPGQPVERVELGPIEPVERAVDQWRRSFGAKTGDDDPGSELRKLLWQPLEKYVAGAKTVLISPNSTVASLPWAALPGKEPGTYLIGDVAIALVPIPSLLPELMAGDAAGNSSATAKNASLMLIGDVDFGADPGNRGLESIGTVAARGGQQLNWPSLPGTRDEVAAIQASFAKHFGSGVSTVLTKDRATKSAVRGEAGKFEYLHISTHGFFAPPELKSADAARNALDPSADAFAARQDVSGYQPGLLSGLVLAGANQQNAEGKEDGILTALEVAEMDLSHVRLATLSACETGLGQTAGAEGLLGLQRAFQTAGAKTVVASLWKVPDKATQTLMARFYDNLWNKKLTKLEALREAQRWLLREGAKQPDLVRVRGLEPVSEPEEDTRKSGGLSPRYWAAFVLSGDWR